MDNNSHIVDYLDYYTSLTVPPNYAILLRGKWGSGKSWFIKKYIESKKKGTKKEKHKFLAISLYGVTSYDDIEKAFFKELHPFLASDELKLVGAIFKGIVKSTIKIDLDLIGDGKKDLSLSGVIPDVQLVKALKENKDCILVFDDLERCSIPLRDLLGYINQLVENDDIKVIIIANEEELIRREEKKDSIQEEKKDAKHDRKDKSDDLNSYSTVKEKLIGKTFEVQTDIDSAINYFIEELRNKDVKSFLTNYIDLLKGLFVTADYNNLRHLRQSILDFERFYVFLPKDSLEKVDLSKNIVEVFFALSFELKKGIIKLEEIPALSNGISLIARQDKDNDSTVKQIDKKYRVFNRHNPISSELWFNFFKRATINEEQVKRQIVSSIYYINENTPDWKKLSEYFLLEEESFKILFTSVYEKFETFKYNEKNELIYVVSILLFFSDKGIIDISKEDILLVANKNFELLKKSGALNLKYNEKFYIDNSFTFNGVGWDIDEFIDFLNKVKQESEYTRNESLEKVALELLNLLSESIDEFEQRLIVTNYSNSEFYEIPILKYIQVEQFVDVFWKMPQISKRYLGRILVERYSHHDFNQKLDIELDWLRNVEQRIRKSNDTSQDKLTKYLVKEGFLNKIEEAIKLLSNSVIK